MGEPDAEVAALQTVADTMLSIDVGARKRVLEWALERFVMAPARCASCVMVGMRSLQNPRTMPFWMLMALRSGGSDG